MGGAKEQMAVSAKSPLLRTEKASLGRVVDQEAVVDFPLVNRNFPEILGRTAETNTDIVGATQLGAGSQEIRAQWSRKRRQHLRAKRRGCEGLLAPILPRCSFLGRRDRDLRSGYTLRSSRSRPPLYDARMGEEEVPT